jgi:hypothetical protein
MWRVSISRPEKSDEVKTGKRRLPGDLVEIDLFTKVLVNKKLRLHDPAVEICLGKFRHHSKNRNKE